MTVAAVGARPLLIASLHQDRKNIAPWIALITALAFTSMLAFAWVFPDSAAQVRLQQTVNANPAFALIFGSDAVLTSGEGFTAWRSGQLGYFFAALMAILIVVRNSRANEDSGQAELIASTVVSRNTRLIVAVSMGAVASTALGVVSGIVTVAFGGQPHDIFVITAGYAAAGLVFTGIAAICAQIGSDSRAASTYSVVVLAGAFLGRGVAQVLSGPDWVLWLTPFGWLAKVHPVAENNLWPFAVCLGFALVCIAIASWLQARRDFGLGLVPVRNGADRGRTSVPLTRLALRLNGASLLTWAAGLTAVGCTFGYLASSMADVFANNPGFAAVIAAGQVSRNQITFEFLGMLLKLAGLMAAIAGAQVLMRFYKEEIEYRLEPLIAGSLHRGRLFGSVVLLAIAAPTLLLAWAGTVMGSIAHSVDSSIPAADVRLQAFVEIPAVWVLIGVSIATVGARPAVRLAGWLAIVATFALTILAPIFNFWDWVMGISPMWHVPNVVAADPGWRSLLGLAAIAAGLLAVGFAGFRRRDLH